MASGKSTVATALSNKLGWQVVDLDHRIEAQEERTITEIFSSHGEQYFRDIETRILRELLKDSHVVVLRVEAHLCTETMQSTSTQMAPPSGLTFLLKQ